MYRISLSGKIKESDFGYSEERLREIINGKRGSYTNTTHKQWIKLLNKLVLYKLLKEKVKE